MSINQMTDSSQRTDREEVMSHNRPPGQHNAMPPVTAGGTTGWAVQRADGSIIVEIGDGIAEQHIWQIALGWPTKEEIEWEKQHGTRAFRCRVTECADEK